VTSHHKGFTLIELLVVIAIIAMLLAILMPALSKVKKIAQRVVCGTNLKGLGTAQTVYANDYDDEYAVQGAGNPNLTWSPDSTTEFADPSVPWSARTQLTVGASFYLLVREADVSPKSFVCPSSNQSEYDGYNANNLDIVELFDFGAYIAGNPIWGSRGPKNCVSYSYQAPYKGSAGSNTGVKSSFAADGSRSAAFAVMADKNPWFDPEITETGAANLTAQTLQDTVAGIVDHWSSGANPEKFRIQAGNSQPHGREGQNVVFADGHSENEKTSDVAVKNDNIYTIQNAGLTTDPTGWRVGDVAAIFQAPAQRREARRSSDSYLVNDDYR
jgi:prepilin-type N-terminal cleavage/methylation domain-containing protein/prepilin-type processing-associated H-X9-DG protein